MRHFSGVRNEEEKTFFDQNFLRFFLLKSLLSLVFCLFVFFPLFLHHTAEKNHRINTKTHATIEKDG